MQEIDLTFFINIVLFILPGYIVLYIVNILADYISEKNTFDRIIHYIIFSLFCYILSYFSIALGLILSSLLGLNKTGSLNVLYERVLAMNSFYIVIVAFLFAFVLGFILGKEYFKKGYPNKHLRKFTSKKYTPSSYADLQKKYKKGTWLTFHLKDGTEIQGTLVQIDRDEDKREYTFVLKKVQRFYPHKNLILNLKGKHLVINSKEAVFIEYHE